MLGVLLAESIAIINPFHQGLLLLLPILDPRIAVEQEHGWRALPGG
jgi:hypothetical protein